MNLFFSVINLNHFHVYMSLIAVIKHSLVLRLGGSDLQQRAVQRSLQRLRWSAAQQLPPPSLPGHAI